MVINPEIVKAYDHLTNEEIFSRLAGFEAKAKDIKARMANGERGEIVSQAIVKGDWRDVRKLEYCLNGLRSAWKQERQILRMRGV
jgi:hypothetical protein